MFPSAPNRPAFAVFRLLSVLALVELMQPLVARHRAAAADTPVPVSASERREQLAKLNEGLNAADPLKRLATLDEVLHGNDMLARQLAIETAFGSSDATMRNYAALLMVSKTQIMNLELSMPPEVQARLDKAGDDASAKARVQSEYRWLFALLGGGGRHMTFQLHDFNPDTGQFKVTCQGIPKDDPTAVGQLSGGSLSFRAVCSLPNYYEGECAASLQLGAQGVFAGTLSCTQVPLPVAATLRLH